MLPSSGVIQCSTKTLQCCTACHKSLETPTHTAKSRTNSQLPLSDHSRSCRLTCSTDKVIHTEHILKAGKAKVSLNTLRIALFCESEPVSPDSVTFNDILWGGKHFLYSRAQTLNSNLLSSKGDHCMD